ncbi:MAG: PaaI family thioesterase [Lachnospiraceae bacterium]|nr:PaaI family thioesterase [Lachnospiraceae bacterium]
MNTIEEVRDYFRKDLYATETTGAEIEDARPGYAKIRCAIDDRHRNARGAVMGGVYLTLADFACGVAGNFNIGEEAPCVSATLNMSFLTAAKGDVLFAEARAVKSGKSLVYLHVDITDNLGILVAQASGTNFRMTRRD